MRAGTATGGSPQARERQHRNGHDAETVWSATTASPIGSTSSRPCRTCGPGPVRGSCTASRAFKTSRWRRNTTSSNESSARYGRLRAIRGAVRGIPADRLQPRAPAALDRERQHAPVVAWHRKPPIRLRDGLSTVRRPTRGAPTWHSIGPTTSPTDEFVMSDQAEMPNVFDYVASLGYMKRGLMATASDFAATDAGRRRHPPPGYAVCLQPDELFESRRDGDAPDSEAHEPGVPVRVCLHVRRPERRPGHNTSSPAFCTRPFNGGPTQ